MTYRAEPQEFHRDAAAVIATAEPARVFISYASADKLTADAVCAALEAAGIFCWIAPRDVKPGALYADAIVRAISSAIALVLLLSKNSIASSHVGKEIERASSKKRLIIALRLDAAPLTPALEYFLSESQWIDAPATNRASAYAKLINAVQEPPSRGPSGTQLTGPAPASSSNSRSSRILLIAGIAFAAVASLAISVMRPRMLRHAHPEAPLAATPPVKDKSIAVLPFTDLSERHDQEYFADGLSEELIDVLGKLPDLRVIGHVSAFQFKGKSDDLGAVATQLGANYLVQGSIRRSGDHMRVAAQLIRTSNGAHIWSDTYDRGVADVLQMQSEIAMSLGRALELAVPKSLDNRATVSPETYELYLRGLHAVDKYSREGFEEAASYFQRAIDLDPKFTRAYEELIGTHLRQVLYGFVPAEASFPQIRDDAMHLLLLDPHSAWGHAVICRYNVSYSWNWSAAENECGKALALSPHDWVVLFQGAELALALGEYEKSVQLFRAVLVLDPLNADTRVEISQPLLRLGRLSEAEAQVRRGLAITPTFVGAHYWLGTILLAAGRLDEARREFDLEVPEGGQQAGLAIVNHALAKEAESKAALDVFIKGYANDSAFTVAEAYGYIGNVGDAFEWLERAYRQKDASLQYLKGDWPLRSIEHDARYRSFLRKMNLPD